MKLLRRTLVLVLFAVAVYGGWGFLDGNANPVTIHYVVGDLAGVPLWQALLGAGLLGALLALAATGLGLARARLEARRYRKALVNLEAEVHQLRNLPLVSDEQAPSAEEILVASGGGAGRTR